MAFELPTHLLPATPPGFSYISSLLQPLTDSKSPLTAETIRSWRRRLEAEESGVKAQIDHLISLDHEGFTLRLQTAKGIDEKLGVLSSRVKELDSGRADIEDSLLPTLQAHSSLLETRSNFKVLSKYLANVHSFQNLSQRILSTRDNRLAETVESLVEIKGISISKGWAGSKELDSFVTREWNFICERLEGIFNQVVEVTAHDEKLWVLVEISEPEEIPIPVLLSSLRQLSLQADLLKKLSAKLINSLFLPILSAPESSSRISQYHSMSQRRGSLKIWLNGTSPFSSTPSPGESQNDGDGDEEDDLNSQTHLETIGRITKFILSQLPSLKLTLIPQLLHLVINEHLVPTLPSLPLELDVYLSSLALWVEWEGSLNIKESPILDYQLSLSARWARKWRSETLEKVRSVVGKESEREGEGGWDSVVILSERTIGGEEEATEQLAPFEPSIPSSNIQSEKHAGGDDDDGWGFDDPMSQPPTVPIPETPADEDGWGFGDDDEPSLMSPVMPSIVKRDSVAGEGWGFDGSDDEKLKVEKPVIVREAKKIGRGRLGGIKEKSVDLTVSGRITSPSPSPAPVVSPTSPSNPRQAMKLGKKTTQTSFSSSVTTSSSVNSISDVLSTDSSLPPHPQPRWNEKRVIQEQYAISKRSKLIISTVKCILSDAAALSSIKFPVSPSNAISTSPTTTLLQTIPQVFSLFRALLPVSHSKELQDAPALGMQFVNDLFWLADENEKVAAGVEDKTMSWDSKDTSVSLRALRERWWQKILSTQKAAMKENLDAFDGLRASADDNRVKHNEQLARDMIYKMELLGRVWKPVLLPRDAFSALGSILDYILRQMLNDILSLRDITAKESTKLNELCKLFHSLENLFIDSDSEDRRTTVVAFVPNWLKFCYLSELLEASMIDITYLFESSALIDFEVDELVTLVRALFSDTSLRATTIDKISRGHPVVSSG